MNNDFKESEQQNPKNNNVVQTTNVSGYPSNNGGHPAGNYYPNRNGNQWYNQNNHVNQNNYLISLVKTCKGISIAYIIIWVLSIAFTIYLIIGLFSWLYYYGDSMYSYGTPMRTTMTPFALFTFVPLVPLILAIIFDLVLFILGIILTVKTSALKNYYYNHSGLWVLFLIGIFFTFLSFICSIITISACNKIEAQLLNQRRWKC